MYTNFIISCMAAGALAIQLDTEPKMSPKPEALAQVGESYICNKAQEYVQAPLDNFESILAGSSKYTDTAFPATENSLLWAGYGEKVDFKLDNMAWTRMSEKYPSNSLFGSTGIKPADIIQGSLGNCWFLAACSALAEKPGRLEKIFLNDDVNSNGIYGVNLYALGVPHTVIVDDYMPLQTKWDGSVGTLFANVGADSSMWGMVLEKAWAKFYGNYQHIEGGSPPHAIQVLNGSPMIVQKLDPSKDDKLWADIIDFDKKGHMMSAGTAAGSDKNTNSVGLYMGHAYTVLGGTELSNGVRLVNIRNPHGAESYHGDWSDKSSLWTDAFRAEVGMTSSDDGFFYMTVTDFATHFDSVYFSLDTEKMFYDYYLNLGNKGGSTGAYSDCGASCSRHLFELTSEVDQTVYVSAYTWDDRMITDKCTESPRKNHSMNAPGQPWRIAFKNNGSMQPMEVKAGQAVEITTEWDFSNPNYLKDFSVTAWGGDGWVELKAKNGSVSDTFPVIGDVRKGRDTGAFVEQVLTPVPTGDAAFDEFVGVVDAFAPNVGAGQCGISMKEFQISTGQWATKMVNTCAQHAIFTIEMENGDWNNAQMYVKKDADGGVINNTLRTSCEPTNNGAWSKCTIETGTYPDYKNWSLLQDKQTHAGWLNHVGGWGQRSGTIAWK